MGNRENTLVNSKKKTGDNMPNPFLWDFLWNTIKRFDLIIESTNSKSALLIAFNVFALSGILLKWGEILPHFKNHPNLGGICNVLLAIIAIASVLSLWFTFRAVNPFLKTYKRSSGNNSNLFFIDVAERESPELFHEKLHATSYTAQEEDLSFQIHVLSRGITKKFKCLRMSTAIIFSVQLPALGLFVLIRLLAFLSDA